MNLTEAVIVVIISGIVTLAGSLISARMQGKRWSEGEKPKTQGDAVVAFANAAAQSADTNSKLQDDLDENRQRLGELMLKVNSLEAARNRMSIQLAELKIKNGELMGRITALEQEREALKKRIDDLQTENDELRRMLGKPPRRDTGPLRSSDAERPA